MPDYACVDCIHIHESIHCQTIHNNMMCVENQNTRLIHSYPIHNK